MTTYERCLELKALIERHAPHLSAAAGEFIGEHVARCTVLSGFLAARPDTLKLCLTAADERLESQLCDLIQPLGLGDDQAVAGDTDQAVAGDQMEGTADDGA